MTPDRDKSNTVAHTPGTLPPAPWHVDPDDRPDMEWNNHILSADGNTVCFMAHNPDDNTALENAAHVIKAAPDLLEALKATFALLDQHDKPTDHQLRELYGRVCSAISRAEGQGT